MSDHLQLAGKVAIVTGAAGAIGSATVKLMIKRGASVVAIDRPGTAFEPLIEAVAPHALHTLHADVGDEAAAVDYVEAAQRAFGRIDIFFNNAGIEGVVAPIPDYPLATFLEVLRVNVAGVFLGMKHVIPIMTAQGRGSIINTSSVAGLIGSPGLSAYTASKHAVIGLTKTAAIECGPAGVRVNNVNPGPIESRMMSAIETMASPEAPLDVHQRFAGKIPYGRYGTCEEVALMVAFLASDEADYITGGIFVVDGGMTAS